MPLKTFVKASSITNLSDARYFSAFPVDWLSYECNPSAEKHITQDKIQEISGWVTGIQTALEVGELSNQQIQELCEELNPNGLQLKGNQPIDQNIITNKTIFRHFTINEDTHLPSLSQHFTELEAQTDYFIIDFSQQGTLTDTDKEHLKKFHKYPIIIDCKFSAEETDQLLTLGITGINIQGGEEEKAGIRSFEDIQDIMDALDEWA